MITQNLNYQNIDYHFRAANYLTVAQLFLRDNVLLKRKLKFDDLKPVVIGHWGACPGINFLYSHFCRYIQLTNSYSYLTLGSGHAASALLSNLYLERSLGEIYPDLDYGNEGIYNLISKFGIDPRLQTEVSSALPGVINAGGELGIALACAVGSILNNPRRTNLCIIGDGEFEAGVTMPSLLCKEFLIPKKDGFLILAINLNQYKMGSRSLLSTWSDSRMKSFFSSLGIRPFFCNLSHDQCAAAFISIAKRRENWVKGISSDVPVIILKSKKGTTGPLEIDDEKFVGTHRSHKVGKLKHPNAVANYMQIIERWLKSYKPEELFQDNGFPVKEIINNFPKKELRIGRRLEIDRKKQKKNFLDKKIFFESSKKEAQKLGSTVSPMKIISNAINHLGEKNKNFIVFSPDEGASNNLGAVIERNGIRGNPAWQTSVPVRADGGIIEILNENCCHGMLQGYNQAGRDGLYVTYEAFAPVNASLISQYYKFLKISNSCEWRTQVPSLKYILTSSGWHNCYTHQNPDLLNTLLSKTDDLVDVYFPSDANQALACFAEMFKKNSIQVQVVGKTNFKTLRSIEQSCGDVQKGFWTKSYGLKNKSRKKLYIIAIGDYMVKEAIDACNEITYQHKNLYIKIIIPICSKIFHKEKLKMIFNKEADPKNVIVICTGYVNIFRGMFGAIYDTKNWKFLGYSDGFSLNQNLSTLDINNVSKDVLIKYIKKAAIK